ncbi:hypothetical protein [Campylobacter sp. 19-13652]|uniref:hypothetical protein n=1 Tax=Campylobacter sp. 19-13652 TaxID=2840180 RepID=UPI001C74AE5B|nr:hypothetical protein [Campylobacter sp. 19-13652]BCX79307.1 hypothetical protein LBC_07690 [Campylobacter sp. 19-13652]
MEYNIAFARLEYFLPFLHIASTVVYAGALLGFTLVGRKLLISESRERFSILLSLFKSFSVIILVSLFLILISAGVLLLEHQRVAEVTDPMAEAILATKAALWIFLLLNTLYTLYHYKKSVCAFSQKDMIQTHESLILIVYYFIPLNLLILVVAGYLGLSYRGFM